MKILPNLVLFVLAAAAMSPSARAIDTAAGFEPSNPAANSGSYNSGSPINAQLSGLGATGVYGSYDAPNIGFAAWEKWSSGSFASLAPQYSGASGILSASLTQSNTSIGLATTGSNPGIITVDDATYYGRLAATSTSTFDFSLTGTSSIAITSITLQIKHSTYSASTFAFNPTLDGIGADEAVKGANLGNSSDAISLSTNYFVYTYTWSDLSIAANQPFALSFSLSPGAQLSLDSIAVSATAVPEPGTWGLAMAFGLFALVVIRRKRFRSSASV